MFFMYVFPINLLPSSDIKKNLTVNKQFPDCWNHTE